MSQSLPSRPPRPPRQPVSHPLQRTSPRVLPASSQEAARKLEEIRAAEAAKEAQLLRTRRFKVYAVAIAVVVVASSIFGAQIKTAVQEWRRREDIKAAADLSTIEEQIVQSAEGSKLLNQSEVAVQAVIPANKTISVDRDIVRQIALLEDRRALLDRQKGQIQVKINRMHERQAREAEMESRRAGPGFNR